LVTIAVVAMGEMGSGVAGRLVDRGARVLTSLAGRSAASAERARSVGVETVDDAALIRESDIFLSIVPPSSAVETAQRFLPLIAASPNRPTFVDCNAIAPQTLHEIAAPFAEQGLPFGDASIIGIAPRVGYSPKLYMSGPIAGEAEMLADLGIETRLISAALGDASALKMAFAGITKGVQAIGTSMVLGAARAGVADAFVAELKGTLPEIHAWLGKMLPTMYAKAYRWDDEMREIAKFLEPEKGAAAMLVGAAELYQHVAEDNRAGSDSEIISILTRFVKVPS
jgi:putative dehydrogenase